MKILKVKEKMSILDAVDFLSSLAEIDITLSKKVFSVEEENALHPYRWLDNQLTLKNQELIVEIFTTIHHYLKETCEKGPENLKDPHIGKGLHSLVLLLGEAVEKIEKFTELFKETPQLENLSNLKEYHELQEYITTQVIPNLDSKEENWEELLGIQEEELIGIQKKGLRDLEDVKEDKKYDLFYIKKEDKKPFYDYDMIRHLKLLYDFDLVDESQDELDSFSRIRQLQDKDFYQKASTILQNTSYLIGSFYKDSMKVKGNPLVASINKALMALMLTANPRNLQSNQASTSENQSIEYNRIKSASEYFSDFHFYLREALHSPEYKKISHHKGEGGSSLSLTYFSLIHKLCSSYFLAVNLQKEMVSFIHRMIQVGSGMIQLPQTKEMKKTFWKELIWEDESIRSVFRKHPNGPIKRVIEAFLKGDVGHGWDPLAHKNTPSHLFTLLQTRKPITFLRMPAPLKQTVIQRAEIAEEFEDFLKGCSLDNKQEKFLLINLLDSTSWEEHARSEAVEEASQKEEYSRVLSVIGLPKKTDFYFQKESYTLLNESDLFKNQLVEQFQGGKQCGFYWPNFEVEDTNTFVKKVVEMIHSIFFDNNKTLTVFERQDFIEIFYFFLTLKAIDLLSPDYMTFSCKDSVDIGSVAAASFFSCSRMLSSSDPWKDEEKDLVLWMLYAPAFFFRERAVQKADLLRLATSMLRFQETVANKREALLKECKALYKEDIVSKIEIKKLNLG